jgi:ketosteroid isomerase-like protein
VYTLSEKQISEPELIELTRAYVALSNAHQLQFVLPMFDENATYFSAYVGEFKGREKIANMMDSFFTRYTDVHWLVDEYQSLGNEAVGFNFVMTATDSQGGEPVSRSAYEILKFSPRRYIEFLEVKEP